MFKRLLGRSQRPLDLISACKGEDRQEFAELFGRAQIFCVCMPPGLEEGIDPNISLEEVLEKIRERFEPFCYTKDSQRRMPLFTDQSLVRKFAHAYFKETKHIPPFQVLGVGGITAARAFGNADVVILNDRTVLEYALSPDDITLIRRRWLS